MKKTLLAAALVAGFAGVAHADSSVTLYGIVDAGYGYQQSEADFKGGNAAWNGEYTQKNTGGHSGVQNGSRWGLKGSEDLGNGTSAIFVLESGYDVMNGEHTQSGKLFGRQAYVGLTGDSWGTFTLGRQYNAGDTFIAPIDPFGTGKGFAGVENVFGGSVSTRYDNVIKYATPVFSGFQAAIGLVFDDSSKEWDNSINGWEEDSTTTGVTLGGAYESGPLYIGASFDYLRQENEYKSGGIVTGGTDTKVAAWNIGGTWDFDVAKLHLLYGGQANGVIGAPGLMGFGVDALDTRGGFGTTSKGFYADGYMQHSWMIGLTAPVGDAGTVMFSYAGSVANNDEMRRWNNAGNLVDAELEATTHNFGLGYKHALSKRTSLYGYASYGWSDLDNNFNGREVETTRAQAIIGLQHRF